MGFQNLPPEIQDMIFNYLVSDCWVDMIFTEFDRERSDRVLSKRLVCKKFDNLISYHAIRILPGRVVFNLSEYENFEVFAWILYGLSRSPSDFIARDDGRIRLVSTIQAAAQEARRLLGSGEEKGESPSSSNTATSCDDEMLEDKVRKAACQAAVATTPYIDKMPRPSFDRIIEDIRADIYAHIWIPNPQPYYESVILSPQPWHELDRKLEHQSTSPHLSRLEKADINRDLTCILAYHGDLNLMRQFLEKTKADINQICPWLGSPLHAAASREGTIPVIQLLLDQGANPDINTGKICSPLHVASYHGRREVVRLLLDYGANPNLGAYHHLTVMSAAKDDVGIVGMLIEHGATLDSEGMVDGRSALHQVASKGHIQVMKLLLDKGLDVNHKCNHGQTPLLLAAKYKHESIAMLLLEKGAQVNVVDDWANTPLRFAIHNRQENLVRSLLQRGADPNLVHNAQQSSEWDRVFFRGDSLNMASALKIAVSVGSYDVVKMLLEHGAHVRSDDGSGAGALYTAASRCHLEIVQLLFEHGATIDNSVSTEHGRLILLEPARRGNTELFQLLVENGADIQGKDYNDWTVLHGAAKGGSVEICQYLIQQGCRVNALGPLGNTPLFMANDDNDDVVELLLKNGADANIQCHEGETPLHAAARQGSDGIVSLLIDGGGADVEIEDDSGFTPLHHAASTHHGTTAQVLIEKGALLEKQTPNGNTPLHLATYDGWLETVRVLLKYGANPNPRNNRGTSPLGYAILGEYKEVENLLHQYGAVA